MNEVGVGEEARERSEKTIGQAAQCQGYSEML